VKKKKMYEEERINKLFGKDGLKGNKESFFACITARTERADGTTIVCTQAFEEPAPEEIEEFMNRVAETERQAAGEKLKAEYPTTEQ
jgi:hypothetical protein